MARILSIISILAIAMVIAATSPLGKNRPELGERGEGPAVPRGAGGLEPRNEEVPNTGRLEPGRWPPSGFNDVQKLKREIDPITGQEHLVPDSAPSPQQ